MTAPKRLRSLAAKALFPALGVAAGLGLGALATAHIASLDPHQALAALAPDRVYIGMDCRHSHSALAALAEAPGPRRVVVVPADLAATPERDEACRGAVDLLRREGSVWWRVLPTSYVCTRLAQGALAWAEERAGGEFRVPAWVIGGELGEPGVSEENLAFLRSEGLLAAAAPQASRAP